jgi:hypothetical protein
MKPTLRNYQSEEDYWRVRSFLREVSLLNERHDYSWCLLRWDYWRWHVNMNIFHLRLEEVVTLWEIDGRIVAVLNPDSPGEAFFQVHPGCRDYYLQFDEPPWAQLPGYWDLSICLDVPLSVLEVRLIQRWRDQGLGEAAARKRALDNDIPNARRIIQQALPADLVL